MNVTKQHYGLTQREVEVLFMMAEGFTQKEIASKLYVSRYTINTHAQHIYEKMDARSSAHAIAKAFYAGIIGVEDATLTLN